MAQRETLPPCIVLGLETQIGLAVVRELGRAGVPVIGIAQSRHAIGLKSRFLARRIVLEEPRSEAMLACVRNLGEEFGEICLLTISEANLSWLSSNRDRLGRVRPILPSSESFQIVLDKRRTLEFAASIGISVPRTIEPQSVADVIDAAECLSFPVVLKWKDPNAVAPLLAAHHLEMRKAEYALESEELIAIARRYQVLSQWPLIQEYCSGVGLGQFFFMHNGVALRRFQHIRVAEWPPEGGFSSVCDSVPLAEHRDLQERSVALLRAIGWEGVAMVEYRYDPASGQAVLMEVNGRFWGSFPLAVHCGAGFALLAYMVQGLGRLPTLGPVVERMRCRMVATEIKRLVRIVFHADRVRNPYFKARPAFEVWRFFSDFLRPGRSYFVWAIDDPVPFAVDLRNAALRR